MFHGGWEKPGSKSPVGSKSAPEQRDLVLPAAIPAIELHNLLTPDEVSRHFSRSDRLKRQLVIWAGFDPMILQRVEYFDSSSPCFGAFRDKFASPA